MKAAAREQSDLQYAFLSLRPQLEKFIARRVRCPQLAEDLASEVYLRLDRVDAFIGDGQAARAMIFRMAANISIDHIRTSKRRAEILEEFPLVAEQMPGPDAALSARSDLAIVDAALNELPEKAREILFQVRVNGMSHGAVAEKLGVSKSLVEKYLARSVRHCRDRLREAEAKSLGTYN